MWIFFSLRKNCAARQNGTKMIRDDGVYSARTRDRKVLESTYEKGSGVPSSRSQCIEPASDSSEEPRDSWVGPLLYHVFAKQWEHI